MTDVPIAVAMDGSTVARLRHIYSPLSGKAVCGTPGVRTAGSWENTAAEERCSECQRWRDHPPTSPF